MESVGPSAPVVRFVWVVLVPAPPARPTVAAFVSISRLTVPIAESVQLPALLANFATMELVH